MASWSITDYIPGVEGMIQARIRQISRRVLKNVKRRTPVRSGTLKKGWYLEFVKEGGTLTAILHNDVDYVMYVERGTRHMRGQKMVEATFRNLTAGVYN